MKKFEFLDITTADVCFVAYGKTLDELFENAGLALFEVMINTKNIQPKIEKIIKVKGHDLLSLMFDWLNELIYYSDKDNIAFSSFNVKIDEKEFELEAVCKGEEIDRDKHEVRTSVKSATYHRMEIKKEGDVWKAQVILDI